MGEEGMGEGDRSGELGVPWAQGESVTLVTKPWHMPAGGFCALRGSGEGDSPTATLPELFGTTLPHPFPSELDCFCTCLPSLPGKN